MARGHITEVDPDTGAVKVLPYCFVDDFGTVIGQAHGDISRGCGAASSSLELKTRGAPFAPSTAGQISKLISSMRPPRRKAPFATPPSSSKRLISNPRLRISNASPRSRSLCAREDVPFGQLIRHGILRPRIRDHRQGRLRGRRPLLSAECPRRGTGNGQPPVEAIIR